ncbi:hypothetical protein Ciccas_009816 [Cichlidogyrus casuarinus]|uniref:Uncharacterized protein n=1 Tax=Cichlidogyrus casuarinus TaxID=1844966 RepID=A0ABD2PXF6_9PLAT
MNLKYETDKKSGIDASLRDSNDTETNTPESFVNSLYENLTSPHRYLVKFRWFIFRNPDSNYETRQETPDLTQDPEYWNSDGYYQMFLQRVACMRRHRLAFPFLASLCFLLLFSLILLTVSIVYRLREANRRRVSFRTINFDKLPTYSEISQKKSPIHVDTEAGPLPQKKPFDV